MTLARLLRFPMTLSRSRNLCIILLHMLFVFFIAGVAFVAAPVRKSSAVMQPVTQLVAIVVRDGAGNLMKGVSISIKIDEPPILEDHDKCLTDEDGTCIVHLLPGTYRVQFIYGWRNWGFIPVEEQEVFTLSIVPRDQILYNFFVIAERDDQLVPMWDMSRDPSEPPEPFLPSFNGEDPLADLNLGPLSTELEVLAESTESPDVLDTTPTVLVVVDELAPGATATPATAIPGTVADEPTTNSGLPLHGLFILLFALLLVVMIILFVVVIANRPKKKEL
ncbi:MAG: hypothetical protein JXB30_04660 [Anaerolineae bacterium]|nr:hypothetical protein [Anaerolineae bacterium]